MCVVVCKLHRNPQLQSLCSSVTYQCMSHHPERKICVPERSLTQMCVQSELTCDWGLSQSFFISGWDYRGRRVWCEVASMSLCWSCSCRTGAQSTLEFVSSKSFSDKSKTRRRRRSVALNPVRYCMYKKKHIFIHKVGKIMKVGSLPSFMTGRWKKCNHEARWDLPQE